MMVMVVVVMLVEVPPGHRRQRHPQHHQEQPEGDVNPDVRFRVRFVLLDGDDGASPPHLGVIHRPVESPEKRKSLESAKLVSTMARGTGENIYTSHR